MKFGISKGGGSSSFQTFTQGKYKCKFMKGIADLNHKNSFGEKPRHIFLIQPIEYYDKGKWVKNFYDVKFGEMNNFYKDKEGNEKPSYFRHYVNYKVEPDMSLSFSLFLGGGELSPSKFGTLCNILFGNNGKGEAKCPYSAVEHFEGDEIIVNVTNSKSEDGKREYANVSTFEKVEGYEPKIKAELDKIKVASREEEEAKAEKFRKDLTDSIEKNEVSTEAEKKIEDISFDDI